MVNFEWSGTDKKPEEDEFKSEKTQQQQDAESSTQKTATNDKPAAGATDNRPHSIGLAALVYETWNTVAVKKGYDEVNSIQKQFLDKHTEKLEEKWLADIELLPELEAGLSHLIVYLPKWAEYQAKNKNKTE